MWFFTRAFSGTLSSRPFANAVFLHPRCLFMRRKARLRKVLRKSKAISLTSAEVLRLGGFGVIALESGFVTPNQKEAVRRLLARRFRPLSGKYWIFFTASYSLTKKSRGARMGKGRGAFSRDVFAVRSGSVVCEFAGPSLPYCSRNLKIFEQKTSLVLDSVAHLGAR